MKCTKRGLYQYDSDSGGKPDKVCLDPKCFRAKKTKRTKAENKSKREQEKELTARLGKIFEKTSKNRYACLVVAARYMLKHIDSAFGTTSPACSEDSPSTPTAVCPRMLSGPRVVNMAEPEASQAA